MFRRLAPRRLGTDEEATVVEHLTELRHRLLISIFAIVPAFLVAFYFHSQLIEWLMVPLPPDTELVTLAVLEPFTTAVKVSAMAAIAIVLPILIWQLWGFLAPAVDEATQRTLRVFIVIGTGLFALGVAFAYFVILPRAIYFLTNFDDDLYNVQIRASYYLSFTALVLLASGIAFEMPMFILALVRIRVLSSAKLRRNRRIGYPLMLAFAVLLPTVDPVSLAFEVIPLLILFEISIWLSVIMEKRWTRNLPDEEEFDAGAEDADMAPEGEDLESSPADEDADGLSNAGVDDLPGDDEAVLVVDVDDGEIADDPPTSEDETP